MPLFPTLSADYLAPGPSNRLVLSLKSGIGSQIDWALTRLISQSYIAPEVLRFELYPGLAEALISFPRRVIHAVQGDDRALWDSTYFEQPFSCDAQLAAHAREPPRKRSRTAGRGEEVPRIQTLVTLANSTREALGDIAPQRLAFHPAQDPEHAALMRRAVEATLLLRNLNTFDSNARYLLNFKGFSILIRDILELPDVILVSRPDRAGFAKRVDGLQEENEEWLELEGVHEMRLQALDMCETLAPKIVLDRRAPFEITDAGEPVYISNTESYGEAQSGRPRPGNGIFLRLLHFAHHSNDRALLVGSLRCLSAMAAMDRNEAAFAELETPEGNLSPGLLRRCVELLAVNYDNDLLEAALELLYQLVNVGNNALRMCSRSIIASASGSSAIPTGGAGIVNGAAAGSRAVVQLLVRLLEANKTVWERDHPLVPGAHRWVQIVPSKLRQAAFERLLRQEQKNALRLARIRMSVQERMQEMRLTTRERRTLIGKAEPERATAW